MAGEDGKATQHRGLRLRQQIVAPVERGAKRLVTRQCSAAPAGQQAKAFVKVRRYFSHAKHIGAHRCQLESQRDAVELAANLQNRRHMGIVDVEAVRSRYGALAKELNGRILERLTGREVDRTGWKLQRGQAMQPF